MNYLFMHSVWPSFPDLGMTVLTGCTSQ